MIRAAASALVSTAAGSWQARRASIQLRSAAPGPGAARRRRRLPAPVSISTSLICIAGNAPVPLVPAEVRPAAGGSHTTSQVDLETAIEIAHRLADEAVWS